MLESTFSNVMKSLIAKHNLTKYQIDELSKNMKYWRINDLIYPSSLKSKLNIQILKMYEILEDIENMGFLEKNYEIYCFDCSRFKGKILKTLTDDLIKDLTCDFCNKDFDVLSDTIMIYRVVKDE